MNDHVERSGPAEQRLARMTTGIQNTPADLAGVVPAVVLNGRNRMPNEAPT